MTLLCENQKRSLILSDAVAEITELREAELLDSYDFNKRGGAKLGPFLTELWVENFQKIN